MSETRALLTKIAALRQHLEQVQGLAKDVGPASAALATEEKDGTERVRRLERQVATGAQHTQLLDSALRQLSADSPAPEMRILPKQLTNRARRVLEKGRGLLDQLRRLADEGAASSSVGASQQPDLKSSDPLAARYRETAAMADTALRMVQAFPDAPSAQLRLCDGLEATLDVVAERIAGMSAVVEQRRAETAQVDALAELLNSMNEGKPTEMPVFAPLAEQLLAQAHQGAPLRFLFAPAERPARFVACHSLTVAQVMARVARHDPQWRAAPLEPVLAALVHDAGMLGVPPEILARAGPLNDDQRRTVEAHARQGAEMMTRLLPAGGWLAEAAAGHHERLDGTGYPAGLRGSQLASLTRLLAVCDVYAALGAPRPQRPALDTRTALADTLLLAEQGALDRHYAERLLQLSFYPVGSVVELADGAIGCVVATHMGRRDMNTLARPVLSLLTDPQGQPLPTPQHVDLAECMGRSIVRSLPTVERRDLLAGHYPELV